MLTAQTPPYFYPRTPCGVRQCSASDYSARPAFLSTYPVRGTTRLGVVGDIRNDISIHVPRAGYDHTRLCPEQSGRTFLSTYPVRGTTRRIDAVLHVAGHFYPRTPCGVRLLLHENGIEASIFLSTYPVRGTTRRHGQNRGNAQHFYPRTPCGVRRRARRVLLPNPGISIHVPRAGYDVCELHIIDVIAISIHVPRAGYDQYRFWQ